MKKSKASQVIEHWRKKIAEKEKEFFIADGFNGGRPRSHSFEPERSNDYTRLLTYQEKDTIIPHPQLRPKEGKQREYLRVRS